MHESAKRTKKHKDAENIGKNHSKQGEILQANEEISSQNKERYRLAVSEIPIAQDFLLIS